HPTGIYGLGVLISEAARGEGGILRNREGKPFMAKYAPTLKDLAPRDMVSRAIAEEVRQGHGIDGKDFVHLDLTHLGKERLAEKLSDISSFVRIYLGLDPVNEPIPVMPTCHYMMGGIPTDLEGRVLDENQEVVKGLFAAGECACVSVHGANRLGCNSLLDLVVFGRRAGLKMTAEINDLSWVPLPEQPEKGAQTRIARLKGVEKGARPWMLRDEMQQAMTEYCSVFRHREGLEKALGVIQSLIGRYDHVMVENRGRRFNTDLLEAIELESLLYLAETILVSAIAREESRGAHFREDFKERDDQNWLNHTLIQKADEGPRLFYKPVTITRFEPKPRVY
ncbi:FAD-binding protein, partial [bacterium]|nr:FAD-binding protein [bacterium]